VNLDEMTDSYRYRFRTVVAYRFLGKAGGR
jgi:hypothetical protein